MKKIYFPLLFLTTVFSSYAQEKLTTSYDVNAIESKAINYQENNLIEKAIAEYAKVDELDTAYFEAQYQIISLLLKLEKTEEAEKLCKKLIDQYDTELPSIYFLTYATIKSDQKNYDEALFYLEKSKNKGSLNVITKYNEAIVYYKIDEKQKALDLLKEVVTLAPTYGQAYYLLGIIAIEDGKASIGLLSLLTYLSIYPGTEAAAQSLNQLNRNLAEIYTLTPQLKYSEGGDDFSELDLILKNNLAQHKDYPLKLDIDNRISRVIQAILVYMNEHQVQGGFFENKYSPWMKAIVQRNLMSPYTYISMSLYEDSYKKQYKKNAKIISNYAANELYLNIYPKLYKAILEGQIFTISNLDTGYFYYQGDDGNLNGLAMQFSQNYYKESEGFFSNNQLDGELKRYNPNGILTSRSYYKEDEINGLVTTYYSTGKVYLEENMKGDLSDGPTTIYYPISTKKGALTYKEDQLINEVSYFFPTGQQEYKYNLVDGKKEGEILVYNEKGTIVSRSNYKNDKSEGLSLTYQMNGDLKSEALFKDNEYVYYKEFFDNGQLSYHYRYENTKLKEADSFSVKGELVGQKKYNTDGDLVESIMYDKGQVYFIEKYKNNKIIERQSINPTTRQLEVTSFKNYGHFYYPNGVLYAEGKTVDGLLEGIWKYYYNHGPLFNETTYVNDMPDGEIKKYNFLGELEEHYFLEKGMLTGLYSYYSNGKLSYTGFYKEDQLHGPSSFYYTYPHLDNKRFYTNGERDGKDIYYLQSGRPYRIDKYEYGSLVQVDFINENKIETLHLDQYKDKSTFTVNQLNVKSIYTLENGAFYGPVKHLDVTGQTVLSSFHLINNKYDGELLTYYANGVLDDRTTFILDKRYGPYEHFNPDGKLRTRANAIKGLNSGSRILYYPEGEKILTSNFELDYLDGEEILSNSQGMPVLVLVYDLNVLVGYKTLTESDELSDIIPITSNETHVESKYKSGQLAARVSLEKQTLHGELNIYNPNGKSAYSQTFTTSKKEGIEMIYYSTGAIYSTTTYQKQQLTGAKIIYALTGEKQFEINYSQGELHGDFHIFENNKIKQAFKYDSGLLSE